MITNLMFLDIVVNGESNLSRFKSFKLVVWRNRINTMSHAVQSDIFGINARHCNFASICEHNTEVVFG